jgi:nitroreductase
MTNPRQPDYPIDPLFTRRWSPRAFTGEPIAEPTLLGIIEAARWAPSSFNSQPWRFLYARRDTPAWAPFFDCLGESNRIWAQRASALVLLISRTRWVPPGQTEMQPLRSHSLDAGSAWTSLALQATLSGWHAHGMGGFDRELARASLGVPEDYAVELMIAIGRQGDKSILTEALQAREAPNQRLPLTELVAEGRFRLGG